MKKQQSIFSWRLLWEGFRQCQMIGILAAVIMVLGAAIVPIAEVLNSRDADANSTIVAQAWNAWEANPLLLTVVFAAPLMTLTLFHFLNNRAASDLYHALPHKRISLYLSYAGAILLWVILLIAVSMLISVTLCGLAHKYISLMMETILPYAASVFLISLLLIGAILLVMSITGTVFTNVVFSAILLLLPRFVMTMIQAAVSSLLPFVVYSSGSGFLQNRNNLVFAIIAYLLGIDENIRSENILSPDWMAIVYTLVLALIYLALGAWAFCRRRSEAAGQAAPTRLLQHVYRIIVTMTYCVFITALLFTDVQEDSLSGSGLFGYIVLYLIGVLIYMLYELITTRKWRNLLTTLPGLGVVLVLNCAVALGMHLEQNHLINQRPAAQEIESVSVGSRSDIYYGSYLDYGTYADLVSSEIEITDPDVISLVSYYLNENIETWESGGTEGYYNKYNTYYVQDAAIIPDPENSKEETAGYTNYIFTIRTDHKEFERSIYIPRAKISTLTDTLQSCPEFVDAWTNPPEPISGTVYLSATCTNSLSDEKTNELYDLYRKELANCSFDELYQREMEYANYTISFEYSFRMSGNTCTLYCPVYADLMPETMQTYYDMIYEAGQESIQLLQDMDNWNFSASVNIEIHEGNDETDRYGYAYEELTPGNLPECMTLLQDYLEDTPVQTGDAYVSIGVYPYASESEEVPESFEVILPVQKTLFEEERLPYAYDMYGGKYNSSSVSVG